MFYQKVNANLLQDQQTDNDSTQINRNFLYDYKHTLKNDPTNLPNDI